MHAAGDAHAVLLGGDGGGHALQARAGDERAAGDARRRAGGAGRRRTRTRRGSRRRRAARRRGGTRATRPATGVPLPAARSIAPRTAASGPTTRWSSGERGGGARRQAQQRGALVARRPASAPSRFRTPWRRPRSRTARRRSIGAAGEQRDADVVARATGARRARSPASPAGGVNAIAEARELLAHGGEAAGELGQPRVLRAPARRDVRVDERVGRHERRGGVRRRPRRRRGWRARPRARRRAASAHAEASARRSRAGPEVRAAEARAMLAAPAPLALGEVDDEGDAVESVALSEAVFDEVGVITGELARLLT